MTSLTVDVIQVWSQLQVFFWWHWIHRRKNPKSQGSRRKDDHEERISRVFSSPTISFFGAANEAQSSSFGHVTLSRFMWLEEEIRYANMDHQSRLLKTATKTTLHQRASGLQAVSDAPRCVKCLGLNSTGRDHWQGSKKLPSLVLIAV